MPRKASRETVLAIGDTHVPAMLPEYVDFLVDIYKTWKCTRVVHQGDVVDWSAISFHEKHPSMPSAGDELAASKEQVKLLTKAFPVVDVMIGNHDDLPNRQAKVAGLPSELLLPYEKLWDTPKWTWHSRFSQLVIDGVVYQHGDRGRQGKGAAMLNATENFNSLVQGHLHSQCGVTWLCNDHDRIFAMQTGCGIDIKKLAFDYGRKFNHRPILGCGVIVEGEHAFVEVMKL